MNLTNNLSIFFKDSKIIYINIAIILGLILIFIILPFPIPLYITNIAKIIIIFSLLYLFIENFKVNINLMKNTNDTIDDQNIVKNTLLLSSIVNILLIILIIYIWYIIFF